MTPETRSRTIENILFNCESLERHELEVLTDDQLNEIDATDCRWCETVEDVSLALFSTYEFLER